MENNLRKKLISVAKANKAIIGENENNVKHKILGPFLNYFGFEELLDFEHSAQGSRFDINIGIQSDSDIVVEAKRYDKRLDECIEQLNDYCKKKNPIPLLAILANGEEIRIYAPNLRESNFSDKLIYSINRNVLDNDEILNRLSKILLRQNLEKGNAEGNIYERQQEIRSGKEEINQKIKEFENSISEIKKKIGELENLKVEKEKELKEKYLLPVINEKIPKKVEDISTNKNKITKVSSKRNIGNEYLVVENRAEITLNKRESALNYYLIPYSRKFKNFFPEKKTKFLLKTDIGTFSAAVQVGDYIKGTPNNKLKEWYEQHKELTSGDKLIISVLEPFNKYKLELEHY